MSKDVLITDGGALVDETGAVVSVRTVVLTQEAYDALDPVDDTILYVIVG